MPKIKKIKKLRVNSMVFNIVWTNGEYEGASFDYEKRQIELPANKNWQEHNFMVLCHELQEICATEMGVRFRRNDCMTDFIFVFDHRQFTTMQEMFAGLLIQFLVD